MHRVVLSFLVSFMLLMAVIAINRVTYNREQEYSRQTEHSRNVIKLYDNVTIHLRSAELFSPTYENSSAKDIYALYKNDIAHLQTELLQLRDSIHDNRDQVLIVDSIKSLLQKLVPVLEQRNIPEMISSGDEVLFPDLLKAHQLIQQGLNAEEFVLRDRKKELRKFNQLNNIFTLLVAIFAIIIITVTFFNQFFLSKRSLWLEGFLESILNTTQNGIVYYKAIRKRGKVIDFKVEFANKSILHLLNIDPNKVIKKKLSQFDSYVHKTSLFSDYVKAVETGEPVQLEHLYKNEGIEKWVHLSITKLRDGITVAIHDISEIKRYEEKLKMNIAALEQSNRELEEYAYAASHDLQEPLRKIKTFSSYLLDAEAKSPDEKNRQQLEKILQSAERMSLLIKDLLSFSSLQSKEEFELTDLTKIFENVLEDLEVLIAQKKAIVTHDSLPEIEAIPVQINQLFYNLVNNSLKFSKQDLPLHLDVSCKLVSEEEQKHIRGLDPSLRYYEIVFSDNGIGFSQDYAVQIFGMFKRLNDKVTYAGSGIGLALCKKVVTNHNGVIEANGKENVGAQFYIYLPQQQKTTLISPAAVP